MLQWNEKQHRKQIKYEIGRQKPIGIMYAPKCFREFSTIFGDVDAGCTHHKHPRARHTQITICSFFAAFIHHVPIHIHLQLNLFYVSCDITPTQAVSATDVEFPVIFGAQRGFNSSMLYYRSRCVIHSDWNHKSEFHFYCVKWICIAYLSRFPVSHGIVALSFQSKDME